MEYQAPIGAADPNDPYVDGNPGTGTPGSPVPAAAIEGPMREIVNAISAGGLTPDPNDLTQLSTLFSALVKKTSGTGAMQVPVGTTAQRDGSPSVGDWRENTTTGQPERWSGTEWAAFGAADALLHVRDEKAGGTDAGTFTSGAWRTRTLNTVATNTIAGASLSANQITLPPGTYWIHVRVPAAKCDFHKAKLRNITDGTDLLIGSSADTATTVGEQSDSVIQGQVVLAATKTIELQHRCATTNSGDGFGVASGFGVVEVYAEINVRMRG
ncbi:hypothetical protein [Amphritea sp. HPY]|uniref:hypothetical protein n=1 Tax=Amphritea sp. HPY TaxID=3421652 RepID=UPI003D7C4D04